MNTNMIGVISLNFRWGEKEADTCFARLVNDRRDLAEVDGPLTWKEGISRKDLVKVCETDTGFYFVEMVKPSLYSRIKIELKKRELDRIALLINKLKSANIEIDRFYGKTLIVSIPPYVKYSDFQAIADEYEGLKEIIEMSLRHSK